MSNRRRPLIESFRICGLHGFKDVEVTFDGVARIVIAENGMGKTTILSTLSSFLQGDFEKLRLLPFKLIECKFSDRPEALLLRKDQLPQSTDVTLEKLIYNLSRYSSHDATTVRSAVLAFNVEKLTSGLQGNEVLQEIYFQSPYSLDEFAQQISDLQARFDSTTGEELKRLEGGIKAALGGRHVLHLPTYRRVEMALQRSSLKGAKGNQFQRLETLGVRFGLSDVEDRIASILSEIQTRSNLGYREFSANVIDDLLASRFDVPTSTPPPDFAALQRFFARVEKYDAPSNPVEGRTKMLQALYESGEIRAKENDWLRYFLSRLTKVVSRTMELEANIEQFVARVNSYLESSSDEKALRYDPRLMKVVVRNLWTESDVKMDDLSSGEKQLVSLFAHIYLYPQDKIILIDEPELSLSIDWQKRILPDVVSAQNCRQLLAITHSPFIFDNELDPYAGPLVVKRYREQMA